MAKARQASARDALRAATVGARAPRITREVVLVVDPETGPREAVATYEQELDDSGTPRADAEGNAVLKRDEFGLLVPTRDEAGDAVLVESDRDLERFSVEVRLPTGAERARILRLARIDQGAKADLDRWRVYVEVCLTMAYVPGTDERVWEAADRKTLEQQPAGGFVDAVGRVGYALLFPEVAALGKAARAALTSRSSSGSSSASAG